jgi:Domain of unknown function (DUF5658)
MSASWTLRRFLTYTGPALCTVLLVAAALAQPRSERDGGPPFPRERGPGPPGFSRGIDWPSEAIATKGFVFLDGEYVAPPYQIRYVDGNMTINDRALTCIPAPRGFGGRGFGPPRAEQPSWRFMVEDLAGHLRSDSVLVSFKDQPYWPLDIGTALDLLASMAKTEGRSLRHVSVRQQLPDKFDKKVWDEWIERFVPSDELKGRAAIWVSNYNDKQERVEGEIEAARWMERLAYPLTVSSMVLIVLSIGHLLGGRPHAGQPTFGVDKSPQMIRALEWSLFFAAAFSSIDLIWTILAASTNQMRELNPIGSHLIENPRHLAGFKIGITFSCLALLWLLRRHKRAQIAAWWVCLILTLVTIRWLAFKSIMV